MADAPTIYLDKSKDPALNDDSQPSVLTEEDVFRGAAGLAVDKSDPALNDDSQPSVVTEADVFHPPVVRRRSAKEA